ncbi:NAD(P)-dependent oxidoreductase [Bordetella sp. N]|uniref:NAD(P)-dependent oxidoreductase n=1 Tax=Bordetella sp. N TaxID=1746199 RepID=UPI00070BC784|nr:NAD(P)-dependent oxidoreductase [Bordetella sp. N]ALM82213.1 6-phosphogluconate dehydrogenase [Bordetella sp. N]
MGTIGFVGLGNMGRHMATRIAQAGHDLVVFDIKDLQRKPLEAAGAKWVDSVGAVADVADTVIVSLPTPAIVDQVLAGDQGLISGSAVRVIIDTSTTGPSVSKRLADTLLARDIRLVDAPVSGGVTGAEQGTLTVMASGQADAYAQAEPLLKIIGKNIFYLGPEPGQGQMMKTINNTLCAAATLASFEGLVLGSKAGLDPKTMLDIINVSSGRNFATEVKIPQCILHRDFPMRFTTELLHKDVKLCIEEGARLGVPMWVSDMARQMLSFAIGQGMGADDYARVIQLYENWGATQFGNAR